MLSKLSNTLNKQPLSVNIRRGDSLNLATALMSQLCWPNGSNISGGLSVLNGARQPPAIVDFTVKTLTTSNALNIIFPFKH